MRKILVVEDEDILRETYELVLSTQPYHIDVARNGQEALEKCAAITYDLILLDLMMPVLDGVGFLNALPAESLALTKIVVFSNLSSGNELETALRLGAERSFLKSSLSPRDLISMVRYELEAR